MASKSSLSLWRVWARSGKVRSSVLVRASTREAAIEQLSAGTKVTRCIEVRS